MHRISNIDWDGVGKACNCFVLASVGLRWLWSSFTRQPRSDSMNMDARATEATYERLCAGLVVHLCSLIDAIEYTYTSSKPCGGTCLHTLIQSSRLHRHSQDWVTPGGVHVWGSTLTHGACSDSTRENHSTRPRGQTHQADVFSSVNVHYWLNVPCAIVPSHV